MKYDIFISYRRGNNDNKNSGTHIARSIKQQLELDGYNRRVFFDYSEISDGEFQNSILPAIARSKVLILVLTKGSMDRCVKADDWVRREILHARQHGVKIVPVNPDNQFDGFPADFPQELDVVRTTQHTTIHTDSAFERDIHDLVVKRIRPVTHRRRGWIAPDWSAMLRNAPLFLWAVVALGAGWFVYSLLTKGGEAEDAVLPQQGAVAEQQTDTPAVVETVTKKQEAANRQASADKSAAKPAASAPATKQTAATAPATASAVHSTSASAKPKTAPAAPAVKTYKVGELYDKDGKRGIVFEVNYEGTHGKIVSLDQTRCEWAVGEGGDTSTPMYRKTYATSKQDGMANQHKIMQIAGWQENYPAFAWCASHGEGWYLPAVDELKKLLCSKQAFAAVNATLRKNGCETIYNGDNYTWYWTSTEDSKGYDYVATTLFYMQKLTNGYGKCDNYYVRAVCAF